LLLDPLLQELTTLCVSCITAHPSIKEVGVSGLMELLELLGFEKRFVFTVNTIVIDTSAGLSSSGRVTKLDSRDYRSLFVGSAFFACGGGVPYEHSISLMHSSARGTSTDLVSLDDFSPDDWLCTVYAIGASGHGRKQYESFLLAIKCLEEHLGAKIKGVIPGEIGSEINAVWVANQKNIALVDADMVGGRAVPEEQMDIYGLYNVPTTPVIIVNDQGDMIVVKVAHDSSKLENVYRAFAVASGGYCYIASRPISQAKAKALLPSKTVSMAISTGRQILACKTELQLIDVLQESCGARLLAAGNIVANTPNDAPGFLSGVVRISGSTAFRGKVFEVHYKNENIILLCDDKYVCSVPDLISVVDAESLMPVANSSLHVGSNVLVFGTPALPIWRTPKGIAILGPAQFGFDHEYKPIGFEDKTS